MKRWFLSTAFLLTVGLIVPAAAPARGVPHANGHAFIYAVAAAQRGADWMFPRSAAPLGDVTAQRGCDRQSDGSFDCVFMLRIWSSGAWHGSRAPRRVESWACAGPIDVHVRRTASGNIATSTSFNPCRPDQAPDPMTARLLFVAAVHRQAPQVGRVLHASCESVGSVGDPSFHCTSRTRRRSKVVGDVLPDGTAQVGAL